MRLSAAAMALSTLGTLGALLGSVWAAGCTGLSKDCELNLTCPTTSGSSSGGPDDGGADASDADGDASCANVFVDGECNTCLVASCCQAILDCKDDANCLYCLNTVSPDDPKCTSAATQMTVNAFYGCDSLHCSVACAAKDTCNPITNNGCGSDGTACDLAPANGTFECFPPPNSAQICGVCDNTKSPYCAPGLHCYAPTNTCARFCCNDADCGGGVCELDALAALGSALTLAGDMVGVCLDMHIPDGGVDGGGTTPACGAPATSMSMGSCVGGFPGM